LRGQQPLGCGGALSPRGHPPTREGVKKLNRSNTGSIPSPVQNRKRALSAGSTRVERALCARLLPEELIFNVFTVPHEGLRKL